jgi:hypothetical protein
MAPERFDTDSSRIGPAADVFAWGVVVTYAGTGRTPFGGDSAAATAGAILTRPPRLDGLPAPLRDLIARTLDKDPDLRPTAFELLDELVTAGAPTTVTLAARPELRQAAQAARKTGPRSRRWRRVVPALAVAAVIAIATGVLALTPAGRLLVGEASPGAAGGPSAGAALTAPSGDPRPSADATPGTGRLPGGDPAEPAAGAETPEDGPAIAPPVTKQPQATLCRDADVEITITAQSDNPTAPGTQKGLVSVANRSGSECRLDGRVFVSLYNAADEQVRVPVTSVDEPGEPVDILLRPGTGAFQGIKWVACDRADSNCPTGNTLRGSLASSGRGVVAAQEGFPDPARSLITMKSLKIGTLQSSTQAVVAW